MPATVSAASASLVTLCLESCLYGVMMVLFAIALYLLHVRSAPAGDPSGASGTSSLRRALTNPFISSSIIVAMCETGHWLVTCIRGFMAFVTFQGGTEPTVFYLNGAEPTQVASTALIVCTSIFCDLMCIYRTWVVWGHSKTVIIFPVCTFIGLIVGGIGLIVEFSKFEPNSIFAAQYGRWITCDISFTLCTNVYTTAAIAWKLLKINKEVRLLSTSSHLSVLGIVVESAFLYTAAAIFFSATYQSNSNLQFIAVNCMPAIAGIAFMLINVRVGLGWARKSFATVQPNFHTTLPGDDYALHPLAINFNPVVVQIDHEVHLSNKASQSRQTDGHSM